MLRNRRRFSVLVTALSFCAIATAAQAEEPAVLDASRIICGPQYKGPNGKPAPAGQCEKTAKAFYEEEWRPQVKGLLAGVAAGFEELTPPDSFLLPDGTMIAGPEVGVYAASLFGSNKWALLDVTPDFKFKPLDADTVLVFGTPTFTIRDDAQGGAKKTVKSVQLSVYRRTKTTPRGWEEVGEFWTYHNAMLGPKPAPAK